MLADLGIYPHATHSGASHAEALPLELLSIRVLNSKLLLVRDPRDTTISGYFQCTKRLKNFNGSLSEFIRDDRHGIRKVLHFHDLWGKFAETRSLPVVRYEELGNPDTLIKAASAFGEKLSHNVALRLIDAYTFAKMHRMEKDGKLAVLFGEAGAPADRDDPESYKVRRGKIGGYVDYASPEDIHYMDACMRDYPNPFYG
jgi:hypothetical protein